MHSDVTREIARGARAAVAVLLALASATLSVAFAPGLKRRPAELLPDLYQRAPFGLVVTASSEQGSTHFRLGFASAVENAGVGPLLIEGRRESTQEPTMRADQIVRLTSGATRTYPDVGELRYVVSATHEHWHLEHFERYELLRASDLAHVASDQKTGFCLGDRYPVGSPPPSKLPLTTLCGLSHPELLQLREGISPGFGEVYPPIVEGQYLQLTGLPAGDYLLVNQVNADRALHESSYANDSAYVLFNLSWPDGTASLPQMRVLQSVDGRPGLERHRQLQPKGSDLP